MSDPFVRDWAERRLAAFNKAVADTEAKSLEDLAFDLCVLSDDCQNRAGDITDHAEAEHDLLQSALCLRVVRLLREKGGQP